MAGPRYDDEAVGTTTEVVDEWTVMHDWRCHVCTAVNKGNKDDCHNCGKPIDDNDPEILPGDMSKVNAVTDPKLLERFKAGRDLICGYCKTRQPKVAKECIECGGPLSDSIAEAAAKIESGKMETIKGSMTTLNSMTGGKDVTKPITVTFPTGFEAVTSAVRLGKTVDRRVSSPSNKVVVNESTPYRSSSFKEPPPPPRDWMPLLRVLGVGAVITATCWLLWFLFATHQEQAQVTNTRWAYNVAMRERHIRNGQGWRQHSNWPAYTTADNCVTQQWGTVNCNPYQCNPHRVGYNCNPHRVSYSCSKTCYRSTRSCSYETRCSSRGNRSSSCRSVRTCSPSTESYSCPDTCYRTDYDTCYRTEYDTCYHQCPVMDDMCTYHFPTWEQVATVTNSERDHNPVRPALDASFQCGGDPEATVANHGDTSVNRCVTDTLTFTARIANENGHTDIAPRSRQEYDRYVLGHRWLVNTNRAGMFSPQHEIIITTNGTTR